MVQIVASCLTQVSVAWSGLSAGQFFLCLLGSGFAQSAVSGWVDWGLTSPEWYQMGRQASLVHYLPQAGLGLLFAGFQEVELIKSS